MPRMPARPAAAARGLTAAIPAARVPPLVMARAPRPSGRDRRPHLPRRVGLRLVEGYYRPTATGGFEIQSVYPTTSLATGTIPVVGGTGLGGSRSVPPPIYIHPPTGDDRDRK